MVPIDFFTYHFKAHTISNKLVSKVFAQKKGGKSYDSYKYVFPISLVFRYSLPRWTTSNFIGDSIILLLLYKIGSLDMSLHC